MERTLAVIKPDAFDRCIVGKILNRIETNHRLRIVDMHRVHMTKEEAEGFYDVHEGKDFFARLTDFMSSGPCMVLLLEGKDVIAEWRTMMGQTDCRKADSGTIRGDFCIHWYSMEKNLVHGSDSPESAEFEINYFF